MGVKRIVGLILIIGTILTPFAIRFIMCLNSIIEKNRNGEIPDEDDVVFAALYVATILIGTGIVLMITE